MPTVNKTVELSDVTTLPYASSTATTTVGLMAAPALPAVGGAVRYTSFRGTAGLTTINAETLGKTPSVAVRVNDPAVLIKAVNVAIPLAVLATKALFPLAKFPVLNVNVTAETADTRFPN